MKVTVIPPATLGGTGSIGSGPLSVPTSTPAQGNVVVNDGTLDTSVPIGNPGTGADAESTEALPGHLTPAGGPGRG
jgi:hypothetical protein